VLAGPPAARQDCRAVGYFRTEVNPIYAPKPKPEQDDKADFYRAITAVPADPKVLEIN
jgi:hypothetical protein